MAQGLTIPASKLDEVRKKFMAFRAVAQGIDLSELAKGAPELFSEMNALAHDLQRFEARDQAYVIETRSRSVAASERQGGKRLLASVQRLNDSSRSPETRPDDFREAFRQLEAEMTKRLFDVKSEILDEIVANRKCVKDDGNRTRRVLKAGTVKDKRPSDERAIISKVRDAVEKAKRENPKASVKGICEFIHKNTDNPPFDTPEQLRSAYRHDLETFYPYI